jgi:hypothetical protein
MTDSSFTVIQVDPTNPEVWHLVHCHINIHQKSGMAVLLDVGEYDSVEAVHAMPDSVNLCPTQPDNNTMAVNATEAVEGGPPEFTGGMCYIKVNLQAAGETPIGIPTDWHPDNNIIVKLAGSDCDVAVSPTWTVSGWNITNHYCADCSKWSLMNASSSKSSRNSS